MSAVCGLLCCCNPSSPCTCGLTAVVVTWPATVQFLAPGFNYQNDPTNVIPFSGSIVNPSWVLLKEASQPVFGCRWSGISGLYALQYPGGPNGTSASLLVRFSATLEYYSATGLAAVTVMNFQFTPDFIGFDDPGNPPVFGIAPQFPVIDVFHSPGADFPCFKTGSFVNAGSPLVPSLEHAE